MANKIELKGPMQHDEAVASGSVLPGSLLEVTSTGAVKVHATEGGYAEKAFAKEDALQGQIVSHAYLTTELVFFCLPVIGSEVNALIKAGEDISIGDQLISAGDGTLIALASASSGVTVKEVIAYAMEAIDLSGSGAVTTLAAVRVV